MDTTLNTSEMGYKIVYAPDLWGYTDGPADFRSYMRQTERGVPGTFRIRRTLLIRARMN